MIANKSQHESTRINLISFKNKTTSILKVYLTWNNNCFLSTIEILYRIVNHRFQHIPALFYTEWLRNKNLAFPSEPPLSSAAYSQQLPPQQQDCSNIGFYNSNTETPTESSDSVNSTQSSCGEQKKKCDSCASKIPLIW